MGIGWEWLEGHDKNQDNMEKVDRKWKVGEKWKGKLSWNYKVELKKIEDIGS